MKYTRIPGLKVAVAVLALGLGGSSFGEEAAANPYAALAKYDYGSSRVPLVAIENEIRSAQPGGYAAIEGRLLGVLGSADATKAGKQFACRMLRIVGSEKSVPVLGSLLPDRELAHMARFALQGMACPAAGEALRQAIGKLDGEARLGAIASVAERRDRDAVRMLGSLLESGDATVACAAAKALGRIGGKRAAKLLSGAASRESLKAVWADASLMCADSLLDEGEGGAALDLYAKLLAGKQTVGTRAAAFRGSVAADPKSAGKRIVAGLKSADAADRGIAGAAVALLADGKALRAVADVLADVTPDAAVAALAVLEARHADPAVAAAVGRLAASSDENVLVAAVRALGFVGNGSSVPILLKAMQAGGAAGGPAQESLLRIQGEGVSDALLKLATEGEQDQRATALSICAQRMEHKSLPMGFALASHADAGVRRSAHRVLGSMARPQDLPRVIGFLVQCTDAGDRDSLAQAASSIAARSRAPDADCAPVVAALAAAPDATKESLVGILRHFGGKSSLAAATAALGSANADVRKAAARTLSDWPDAGPLNAMLVAAKSDADESVRVLASRGVARLLTLLKDRPAAELAGLYRQAFEAMPRADERKLLLGGLGKVRHAEALKLAESCLGEESMRQEAGMACVNIAESLPVADVEAFRAALDGILLRTADENLKKRAKGLLDRMPARK